MAIIQKSTFEFLNKLKKNNDRDWFNTNKKEYLSCHENMIGFAENLLSKMNEHDNIENQNGKKCLHRIYRDTRFSKDKTPYKTNFSGGFKRATQELRGGYYFHIQPGNCFLGGGFWGPNSEDLKRIREEIDLNADEFYSTLNSKTFKDTFGEIRGERLKTSPKGYDKDHPAIDLLQLKQFIVKKDFTDKEVLSESFADEANQVFKNMRPFFDFMSLTLTTNSNGESIL
ncbi:MAG: DUF2461 domain-containing protein [Crocinitomicaceae bacterium]